MKVHVNNTDKVLIGLKKKKTPNEYINHAKSHFLFYIPSVYRIRRDNPY